MVLGSAVIAGVVIEANKNRSDIPTQASDSANPTAIGEAPAEQPKEASVAEMKATQATLRQGVEQRAAETTSPWALAHGLIAFGKDFRAANGKPAAEVIFSYAEPKTVEGQTRYFFPERKEGDLVEPHPHLLVKSLLEAGLPASISYPASDGQTITLERLSADLVGIAKIPTSDTEWRNIAWQVSAMAALAKQPENFEELSRAVLFRLEQEQRVVSDYSGTAAQAFASGSPLRAAKTKKTGIFGHSCGGFHLFQAALTANPKANDQAATIKKQLGVLIFRYESERSILRKMLADHPGQGLLLRVQQVKFFGHLVETLTLARQQERYDPQSEGGRRLDRLIFQSAQDLGQAARELAQGGVYSRLDAIRKEREQTYLDLVGDACHAIRGLSRAVTIKASAEP